MHAPMNGFQQLVQNGLPSREKVHVLSRSHAQNEAQTDHLQRISWLFGGYFECNKYCVTVPGWLKKDEQLLTFDCFRFTTLLHIAILLLQTEAGSLSNFM